MTPAIDVWASDHFGLMIANAGPSDDEWVAENEPDVCCYLADADDPAAIRAAEDAGFRIVDVRVTLERDAEWRPSRARRWDPADVSPMTKLAGRAHRISRFYADGLPAERCDDLYAAWLENSFDGYAAEVFVIDWDIDDDDQTPAGYCSVHIVDGVASIGLLAVLEERRGFGLGMELVNRAVRFAYDSGATRIEVVTQGRDVAAQRVYQRAGFVTKQTQVWLHRRSP